MIAIKHRFSNVILCEFDVETVKEAAEQAKANLRGANLYGANLYGANLRWADLRGANLYGADLRGADLYGANLRGANLYGANLDGADLYGANLDGANLYGADLRGANLYGANLRGANLDGEKITKAPLSINGLRYWCLISDGFMRLGCQRHSHTDWLNFTDAQIVAMDGKGALEFWRQWKAPLTSMCIAHNRKDNA